MEFHHQCHGLPVVYELFGVKNEKNMLISASQTRSKRLGVGVTTGPAVSVTHNDSVSHTIMTHNDSVSHSVTMTVFHTLSQRQCFMHRTLSALLIAAQKKKEK